MQKEKSKYKSVNEWRKAEPRAYDKAKRMGMIDKIRDHFGWNNRKPDGYWTKERCLEDARKYSNPTEWNKNSPSARDAAGNKGWYEECIAHMDKKREANGFWTIEKCLNEAKKYKTRKDWRGSNRSSWSAAKRLGVYKECTAHMEIIKTWKKQKDVE